MKVIFRDTLEGTPLAALVKDELISKSGTIILTYTEMKQILYHHFKW
jgi:hypothetical protein